MKIVIAGAGETGTHLTKLLSAENHEIVVIDASDESLNSLSQMLDILTVNGLPTSLSALESASVDKAQLFIAVTPSQDSNIVACTLASRLGAKITVARIDNFEYLQKEHKDFFTELGINYMIYPEKSAAREIVSLINQSALTDLVDFSGGKLSLLVLRLDENSPIAGRPLSDLFSGPKQSSYRVVAISRNNDTLIPHGNDRLRANDTAYIVSDHRGMRLLSEVTGKNTKQLRKVMILGGSRIGRFVAKELEKQFHVKLIEADREKANRLSGMLSNSMIIHGDGTKIDLLLEEGLKNTDAFVAVTGNSETNILSCMLAKQEGVQRVVAEIENLDYLPLAQKMGIDSIINKKLISASNIFQFTLGDKISLVKTLSVATGAEVIEYVAQKGSVITQKPLSAIRFPENAIIGGVVRGESSFIAEGTTQVMPLDHVVVFTLPSAVNEVSRLFA